MKLYPRWRWAATSVILMSLTTVSGVQAQQTKPDNTSVNKEDRAPNAVTADQQKNNQADLETTRQIRQSLMADKKLSTYAHNVKIVTQQGQVTLKGPVRTQAEQKAVEAKAVAVAGAGHVKNETTIAPAKAAASATHHQ